MTDHQLPADFASTTNMPTHTIVTTTHSTARSSTRSRSSSTPHGSLTSSRGRRDASAARKSAAERLATAQRVAEAVDAFHEAADRIDNATAALAAASQSRLDAVNALRAAGLTISEVSDLTGLSQSRVQSLLRTSATSH